MKIKVLGCSAGIGPGLRTSSFLLDADILFDVGTGAGELSLMEMAGIEHVFLTHAHLDHSALLPMMVDAACGLRNQPVVVHALDETIAALRESMFNWKLWPDYAALPSPDRPYLCYETVAVGKAVGLGGREITPLPAKHAVPAAGYQIDSGTVSLVLSGDTTLCDEFWAVLGRIENLKYLVMETTCLNAQSAMAAISGHMTADFLAQGLSRLHRPVEIYITHLEPGREDATMAEVRAAMSGYNVQRLYQGQVFDL